MAQGPAAMLLRLHEQFERTCIELVADVESVDPPSLAVRWREIERLIERHFDVEEEMLLPAFERIAPREAATIREEHARIREAMARAGLEVELHVVSAVSVRALVARLREHALREDASLYAWAVELPSTWLDDVNARLAPKARPVHRTGA
jgi:hypothetical protein